MSTPSLSADAALREFDYRFKADSIGKDYWFHKSNFPYISKPHSADIERAMATFPDHYIHVRII